MAEVEVKVEFEVMLENVDVVEEEVGIGDDTKVVGGAETIVGVETGLWVGAETGAITGTGEGVNAGDGACVGLEAGLGDDVGAGGRVWCFLASAGVGSGVLVVPGLETGID